MNKLYPIKHWLSTLVIGPLLSTLYLIIYSSEKDATGFLQTYLLFLGFGLLFSIPVFIIYFLAFHYLNKTTTSQLLIKTILNAAAIAGVITTFKIIGGSLVMTLSISYSVAIIISSLWL